MGGSADEEALLRLQRSEFTLLPLHGLCGNKPTRKAGLNSRNFEQPLARVAAQGFRPFLHQDSESHAHI